WATRFLTTATTRSPTAQRSPCPAAAAASRCISRKAIRRRKSSPRPVRTWSASSRWPPSPMRCAVAVTDQRNPATGASPSSRFGSSRRSAARFPHHHGGALGHHGNVASLIAAQHLDLRGHLLQPGLQRRDLIGQLDNPFDTSQVDALVL